MKKPNITEGEWFSEENRISEVGIAGYVGTSEQVICDYYTSHEDAEAIVTAVNNTYKKGINPDAVEEMLDALMKIVDRCDGSIGKDVLLPEFEKEIIEAKKALEKAGVKL